MSDSLILIAKDTTFSLGALKSLLEERLQSAAWGAATIRGFDGQIQVENVATHRYVIFREMKIAEAEREKARDKSLFDVRSYDFDGLKRVLAAICDDSRFEIHTDYSQVYSGPEFAARVAANPAWDWRQERAEASD